MGTDQRYHQPGRAGTNGPGRQWTNHSQGFYGNGHNNNHFNNYGGNAGFGGNNGYASNNHFTTPNQQFNSAFDRINRYTNPQGPRAQPQGFSNQRVHSQNQQGPQHLGHGSQRNNTPFQGQNFQSNVNHQNYLSQPSRNAGTPYQTGDQYQQGNYTTGYYNSNYNSSNPNNSRTPFPGGRSYPQNSFNSATPRPQNFGHQQSRPCSTSNVNGFAVQPPTGPRAYRNTPADSAYRGTWNQQPETTPRRGAQQNQQPQNTARRSASPRGDNRYRGEMQAPRRQAPDDIPSDNTHVSNDDDEDDLTDEEEGGDGERGIMITRWNRSDRTQRDPDVQDVMREMRAGAHLRPMNPDGGPIIPRPVGTGKRKAVTARDFKRSLGISGKKYDGLKDHVRSVYRKAWLDETTTGWNSKPHRDQGIAIRMIKKKYPLLDRCEGDWASIWLLRHRIKNDNKLTRKRHKEEKLEEMLLNARAVNGAVTTGTNNTRRNAPAGAASRRQNDPPRSVQRTPLNSYGQEQLEQVLSPVADPSRSTPVQTSVDLQRQGIYPGMPQDQLMNFLRSQGYLQGQQATSAPPSSAHLNTAHPEASHNGTSISPPAFNLDPQFSNQEFEAHPLPGFTLPEESPLHAGSSGSHSTRTNVHSIRHGNIQSSPRHPQGQQDTGGGGYFENEPTLLQPVPIRAGELSQLPLQRMDDRMSDLDRPSTTSGILPSAHSRGSNASGYRLDAHTQGAIPNSDPLSQLRDEDFMMSGGGGISPIGSAPINPVQAAILEERQRIQKAQEESAAYDQSLRELEELRTQRLAEEQRTADARAAVLAEQEQMRLHREMAEQRAKDEEADKLRKKKEQEEAARLRREQQAQIEAQRERDRQAAEEAARRAEEDRLRQEQAEQQRLDRLAEEERVRKRNEEARLAQEAAQKKAEAAKQAELRRQQAEKQAELQREAQLRREREQAEQKKREALELQKKRREEEERKKAEAREQHRLAEAARAESEARARRMQAEQAKNHQEAQAAARRQDHVRQQPENGSGGQPTSFGIQSNQAFPSLQQHQTRSSAANQPGPSNDVRRPAVYGQQQQQVQLRRPTPPELQGQSTHGRRRAEGQEGEQPLIVIRDSVQTSHATSSPRTGWPVERQRRRVGPSNDVARGDALTLSSSSPTVSSHHSNYSAGIRPKQKAALVEASQKATPHVFRATPSRTVSEAFRMSQTSSTAATKEHMLQGRLEEARPGVQEDTRGGPQNAIPHTRASRYPLYIFPTRPALGPPPQGQDVYGFSRRYGVLGTDDEGYSCLGFDRHGRDRYGFNCDNVDEENYDVLGFNAGRINRSKQHFAEIEPDTLEYLRELSYRFQIQGRHLAVPDRIDDRDFAGFNMDQFNQDRNILPSHIPNVLRVMDKVVPI